MIDLSCCHVTHNTGMLIGFSFAIDGSYEGRVLDGYPQFDPDPDKARVQARRLKIMLEEAGEVFEKSLASNLH